MKTLKDARKLVTLLVLALGLLAGCETTDEGVSGGAYYGSGFYDPWYYGGYYGDGDIIVTPPDRPDSGRPHPEHPIARPPASAPRPTPMPSIPSMPRGGGGGGGRR